MSKDSSKYKNMLKVLVLMVVKDLQPFSFVEDKRFKFFSNAAEPGFVVPCRTTMSKTVIPQMYDQEIDKLKVKLTNDLQSKAII